jgi:hypothetical protein
VPETGNIPRANSLLWMLAGAVLFLSFGYTEMQGSDLWWNVAAGREILQNGSFWLSDSWSYTSAGNAWANHEWLADILYYLWVSAFGLESLVYWKWLVVVLAYLILQVSLSRKGVQPAAAFVCAVVAVAVAAPFIDIRPHLYSLLGFSVLLFLLLNRTPSIWKLLLLFVIWVNLHGGFIFGLMALGILIFPWHDLRLKALYQPARVVLLCTIACLLNPDGINSFLLPLIYALDSSSPYRQLGEWLPPFSPGGITSPLFIWALWALPVVALAYALPGVRKVNGVPWQRLVLCALTLLMSLTSRRFIPLFAISFAVMSAPVVAYCLEKIRVEKLNVALAIIALCWGGYRMLPYPLSAGPAYHYLTAEYSYPIDTLNYIEANTLGGNVFALYNWGGYIHWRTDGELKVFIDGRANTVYDDTTYNQYVDVLRGKPGWQELVESSGAEYFLWPYNMYGGLAKFQAMVNSGRWVPVYQDSLSYLLARNTVKLPENPKPSLATPHRMLAAGQLNAFRGDAAAAAIQAKEVLNQIPYQRGACNLAVNSLRQSGKKDEADEISRGCKKIFPSRHLL